MKFIYISNPFLLYEPKKNDRRKIDRWKLLFVARKKTRLDWFPEGKTRKPCMNNVRTHAKLTRARVTRILRRNADNISMEQAIHDSETGPIPGTRNSLGNFAQAIHDSETRQIPGARNNQGHTTFSQLRKRQLEFLFTYCVCVR